MTRLSTLLLLLIALSAGCRSNPKEGYQVNEKEPELRYDDASVHPSRCSYEDCICKVLIPKYLPVYKNLNFKSAASIYFEEEEFLTDQENGVAVRDFVSKNQDAEKILILGYTDGCGNYFYNQILSKKRARGALSLV